MTDFEITESEKCVRLWLSRRLPLEPTDGILMAKHRLREALGRLRPSNNEIMLATYSTVDDALFDVENVLFYNVGSGSLANASRFGLGFQRLRAEPMSSPGGRSFRHFHEYSLVSPPEKPTRRDMTSFEFVPPKLSSATKTHEYWWHASSAAATQYFPIRGIFALYVDLCATSAITNPAAILKPLVDGIVSAMHSCPSPSSAAVELIAARHGWDPIEVTTRLKVPHHAVLSRRSLVTPYRDFVKWDPADELCEYAILTVRYGDASTCKVSVVSIP